MTPTKQTLATTCCLAALAVLWILTSLPSDPPPPPSSLGTEAPDSLPEGIKAHPTENEPSAVRVSIQPNTNAMYFIHDVQGRPISGAGLYRVGPADRSSSSSPLSTSNRDGELLSPADEQFGAKETAVFFAPGYAPVSTVLAPSGGTVVLSRLNSFIGRASTRSGEACEGLEVFASTSEIEELEDKASHRVPSHNADAIFRAVSDARGFFSFSGLPAGRYNVKFRHSNFVACSTNAIESKYVDVPGAFLQVMLAEPYGVKIQFPEDVIIHQSGFTPAGTLNHIIAFDGIRQIARTKGLDRSSLTNNEMASVFLFENDPQSDINITVFAYLQSAGTVRETVRLQPISRIKTHQFNYERKGQGTGSVIVKVTDSLDRELNVPAWIRSSGYGMFNNHSSLDEIGWEAVTSTDSPIEVAAADYKCKLQGSALTKLVGTKTASVKRGKLTTFHFQAPIPISELTTSWGSKVHGTIDIESDKGYHRRRNLSGQRQLKWWLPNGNYRLKLSIHGWMRRESFAITSSQPVIQIDLSRGSKRN